MKNRRGFFRTVILTLFCVAFGIGLIIPISSVGWGFIRANQDAMDTPPELPSAIQTIEAPRAVTFDNSQPRTNPFAQANSFPQPSRIGFAGSDPMQAFVKKIQDAEDEDDKQDAIEDARAALEKHYDRYIAGYQKQVDEMEDRMEKLRDQLDKRKDAKDRLVDLKLEMLISQADGLGWPEGDRRFSSTVSRGATVWRSPPAVATNSFSTVRPILATSPNHPLVVNSPPTLNPAPRVDIRANSPIRSRPDTIAIPPVASASSSRSFKGYFEGGVKLLEKGEYGQFLDQYLEPEEFRKSLKSKTLDQVAKEFEEDNSDKVLSLFEAATKNPSRQYNPTTQRLTWKFEIDGEAEKLQLIRGESDNKWYLLLSKTDENEK